MAVGVLPAWGAATIKGIKARGVLRCGVSEGIAGFSQKDAAGNWQGLEVEFCRAVAAATLGDSKKARFVPLKSSERFSALNAGRIDLLLRKTSWTLGREAGLSVTFPGILFYDGQGFMVRSDAAETSLADLNGKAICLVKGSSHAENTAQFFAGQGWRYTPVIVESYADGYPLLIDGFCQALAGDLSAMATSRLTVPKGADIFRFLPERISMEPLAPVLRAGDDQWATLVRWVLYWLVAAEEHGVTQDTIRKVAADKTNAVNRQALDACRKSAGPLGISSDWAVQVIVAVGNYGEMYDRTLGPQSPYKLDRGLNRLWNQGGLMHAPPLR
jgi:general L-amino acid transport system substrate-binding protein